MSKPLSEATQNILDGSILVVLTVAYSALFCKLKLNFDRSGILTLAVYYLSALFRTIMDVLQSFYKSGYLWFFT
jgi:hypothetical protein